MATQDKRICVYVNARNYSQAGNAIACYHSDMESGWIHRLWEALEKDGRSLRAISLAADLGPNYLNQTRSRATHPVSDKLASILDALGPEAALYIMTGLEISAEDQAFLKLLSRYGPEEKKAARAVIEAVLLRQAAGELPPLPAATTPPTASE